MDKLHKRLIEIKDPILRNSIIHEIQRINNAIELIKRFIKINDVKEAFRIYTDMLDKYSNHETCYIDDMLSGYLCRSLPMYIWDKFVNSKEV